ncbi:hypothetical protein CIK05_14460 [Bdellovibrio sp. qaytius]|nr:hypothetical protein CIK05_14460 [Bdellovibrio sp. qaytius]
MGDTSNDQVRWCFYDPETKTKTADLATDEAQMTILKMRPKDINSFYFSRSDETAWKPLKLLMTSSASPFAGLTLLTSMGADKPEQTPAKSKLQMKAVDQDTQDEIERTFTNSCIDNIKTLAVQFQKPSAHKIEIVMMNKQGMIFRANAVNPTQDGSLCDKVIPNHFHNSELDVVIINSAAQNKFFEKIKIKGKVMVTGNGQYLEFNCSSQTLRSQLIESLNFCENNSHRKKAI